MKKVYHLLLLSVLISSSCAQTLQPAQPNTGPGGSDYSHSAVTIFDYATNGNGEDFWLYEPAGPVPDSANVVVFIHGLGMTNPRYYGAFIKHLVRQGNIVIYPRYQKDLNADNATFTDSCAKGIQRALDTLQQTGHVKARTENFFILGHSVGGILTANMVTRYVQYNFPKPLTAFSMQPGADISALLLNNYCDFSADVKYLVAVGNNDIIVGATVGNKLYNQTTAVPTSHKNLVKHYADNHGSPTVGATHDEPGSADNDFDNGETNLFITFTNPKLDAVDFYCYWKLQDALMDCALRNENCDVAFGDTDKQRFMGTWSDGTPVRELEITPANPTAVETVSNAAAVNVFPNPASAMVYFTISTSALSAKPRLEIFDALGRIMVSDTVSENHQQNISQWKAGIYFYQVKTENSILKSGKIVVD